MSTFGKKALSFWEYDNRYKENIIRYNHTPLDMQLEILNKWYPIGTLCRLNSRISGWGFPDVYNLEVVGYSKSLYAYNLILKYVGTDKQATHHPLKVIVSPESIKTILRDIRLSKLDL